MASHLYINRYVSFPVVVGVDHYGIRKHDTFDK